MRKYRESLWSLAYRILQIAVSMICLNQILLCSEAGIPPEVLFLKGLQSGTGYILFLTFLAWALIVILQTLRNCQIRNILKASDRNVVRDGYGIPLKKILLITCGTEELNPVPLKEYFVNSPMFLAERIPGIRKETEKADAVCCSRKHRPENR